MDLKEPKLDKKQLLEITGVPVTTFNNWFLRGQIPIKPLGSKFVRVNKIKYSFLTAAFLSCISYHKGPNKKQFMDILRNYFESIRGEEDLNEHLTIAISKYGKGNDCGLFENEGAALLAHRYHSNCVFVPVGKLISDLTAS